MTVEDLINQLQEIVRQQPEMRDAEIRIEAPPCKDQDHDYELLNLEKRNTGVYSVIIYIG